MIQVLRFSLLCLSFVLMSLVLSNAAVADPLEDGVKAFSHADYPRAIRLLAPLADKGNGDAQYTLGLVYLKEPDAGPENKIKAHMWLDLAARGGDEDAASERDRMEDDMKPDQVAEA